MIFVYLHYEICIWYLYIYTMKAEDIQTDEKLVNNNHYWHIYKDIYHCYPALTSTSFSLEIVIKYIWL